MDGPLVSIIIPTFNRTTYLADALKSAVGQTYSNLEIIVTDNASRESPQPLVDSFHDPRIRFRRLPVNVGQTANNVTAFQEARGKYVANLHDDDMWHPEFLSTIVPRLEADASIAIGFCDPYVIRADGTVDLNRTEHLSKTYHRASLAEGVYKPFYELAMVKRAIPMVLGTVMRKDAIDWAAMPPEMNALLGYDMYLTYLACRTGMGAYYTPRRLTYVREHPGQISNVHLFFGGESLTYERAIEDPALASLRPALEEVWLESQTLFARALVRHRLRAEGRAAVLRALRRRPTALRSAILALSYVPAPLVDRAVAARRRVRLLLENDST